jgi:gliding motility-associated-like protein
MRKYLILALLVFSLDCYSQVDTAFWFAIPKETGQHGSIDTTSYVSFKFLAVDTTSGTDCHVVLRMYRDTITVPVKRFTISPGKSYVCTIARNGGFADFAKWYNSNQSYTTVGKSEITNKGIYITSDNKISVYYDYDNSLNRDLWTLKGQNGLGTEFFTPFTKISSWNNGYSQAYSSIEIIATEDNTVVDITQPNGATNLFEGQSTNAFTVTLNKGQTYSLRSASQAGTSRPAGTHIVSRNGQKIAVVINDDSVTGAANTCQDILGDQLVPVNILGVQYITMNSDNYANGMSGGLATQNIYRGDQNVVIATKANTVMKFFGKNGRLLYTSPSLGVGGFDYFSPDVTDDNQTSIYIEGVSTNIGFAVGAGGRIVKTTNSGTTWITQTSGVTKDLNSVCFSDINIGYIVGQGGTILNTVDGGASWNSQLSVTANDLKSVFFAVTDTGYAVGNSGTIVKTTNGGGTWVLKSSGTSDLKSVYFLDANTGYAVGSNGTILKTTDGGITWNAQSSGVTKILYSVFFTDAKYGHIVGESGTVLYTANGGATWTTQASTVSDDLYCVNFSTALVGYAVGQLGRIIKTVSGGTTWTAQTSGTANLNAICFTNGSTEFAVGASGSILNTTNSATTWTTTTSGAVAYNSVFFTTFMDASKPFYVYHATGVGCEVGGAIIPPITNCTGSTDVSFFRSGTVNNFTMNLMVPYDQSLPFASPVQTYNFFWINYQDGTKYNIPGSYFEPIGKSGWADLKLAHRSFPTAGTGKIPKDEAVKVTNGNVGSCNKDFFHLGITNGTEYATNKYGYFSSFNTAKGAARVVSSQSTEKRSCFGDPVTLTAEGGLCYLWHYGSQTGPPTYVDNPTAATVHVICPVDTVNAHIFWVEIKQAKCFPTVFIQLTVRVFPKPTAIFGALPNVACAPFTLNVTNNSLLAHSYVWSKQVDGGVSTVFTPSNVNHFTELETNNKTVPKQLVFTLNALRNEGCTSSATQSVTVYPRIVADFTVDDTIGCHPLPTLFTNASDGNTDQTLWDFGDGNGSTKDDTVSNRYINFTASDIVYKAKLTVTSPYYCVDTMMQNITVHPFVKASFAVDTVRGCSPLTIHIMNSSLGPISNYFWDFGDGSPIGTSSAADFTHTYTNTGTSTLVQKIKLTVTNNGCSDSLTRTITTYPKVVAGFTVDTDHGCNPLTVTFTNTTSAAANNLLWNFGDGSSSGTTSLSHLFTNTSSNDTVYHANLAASLNGSFCTDTLKQDITVYAYIKPQFTLLRSEICAPDSVTLTNTSVGGITTYQWDFGDLASSPLQGPTLRHTYTNPTALSVVRNIELKVENSHLCADSMSLPVTVRPEINAAFTPTPSAGCNPLLVDFANNSTASVAKIFLWQFGDGSSNDTANVKHLFTNTTLVNTGTATDQIFNVKLFAESEFGCTDSTDQNITVYPYVKADFNISRIDGCSPLKIDITNTSDGAVTQNKWDYGDGSAIDNNPIKNLSHVYTNQTGNTIVDTLWLTVENVNSCTNAAFKVIKIYPEVNAKFVTADGITEGCNPLDISYVDQSDPSGVPTKFYWEFGDGASTSDQYPKHQFENLTNKEASFKTILHAYSIHNCADTAALNITVYPSIQANFSMDKTEVCSPFDVEITNTSTLADPAGNNKFTWNYGDGGVSGNPATSFHHTYSNKLSVPVKYTASLVLAYNNGKADMCQDTATWDITIYPVVTAAFTQDTLKGCHPLSVYYKNTSKNATRYVWDFGDNTSYSHLAPPPHYYYNYKTTDTTYTVKLDAFSDFNCTGSMAKKVTVYPKPVADFSIAKDSFSGCPPLSITLINNSEAADTYSWDFGDGSPKVSSETPARRLYYNTTSDMVTYDINLVASSIHNCSATAMQRIRVYPKVTAIFSPDSAGCSTVQVPFVNNTINAARYYWNFGDGMESWLTAPSHGFINTTEDDITFLVTLKGESKYGCTHDTSRKVTVYPQPQADFEASPVYMYYPNDTVLISNQTNPGKWNYSWDFKDGYVTTVKDPISHPYQHWGSYNIFLNVKSDHCSDTISHRVRVFPPLPIVDFDASANGCVPLTVQFTDKSTYATSWLWEFDDGGKSSEQSPNYTFLKAGKYNVKLTIAGDGGKVYTFREVEVYPKPEVTFTLTPGLAMLPDARVKFFNTSKLGVKYRWDFGDTTYSEEKEPIHLYSSLGDHTVKLTAWTDYGCVDSLVLPQAVSVVGKGNIRFPNAFTPNLNTANGGEYTTPDLTNEVFHPWSEGVSEFHMEIYNRWGEKLFETDDISVGWNGYYKGKLCKTDVYIWKAKGKFENSKTFEKAGNVTLLR